MEVSGHRQIGRPRLRWRDDIRKNMKEKIYKHRRKEPENVDIENSMRRPQIGKTPRKITE